MNDSRGSTADGIWIGLCVLLVLLLALAGGAFFWIQRQHAARAMAAAEMARAAERESRMQAELAMAAMEQARAEAARQEVEEGQTQPPSANDVSDASAPIQPVIPELYLNQDLWRHIESLADAAPDAKVFTLDPQTGDIRFGDGEHGARPPNGAATIQAEYRTSGGGTVTVYLPAADLQQCRLRAETLTDGTLRLEVFDSKPDD
jgi:hypothetical protein